MHEVRVTVPAGVGPAVAKVALACGIERVSVSQAHVHGPDRDAEVVSVETSTQRRAGRYGPPPTRKAFAAFDRGARPA
jgi:hypothetical protein